MSLRINHEALRISAGALDRRVLELGRLRDLLAEKHRIGRRMQRKMAEGAGQAELAPEIKRLQDGEREALKGTRGLAVVFSRAAAATWKHKRQLKALKALETEGRVVTPASVEADQAYVTALTEVVDKLLPQIRKARDRCGKMAKEAAARP